MHHDHGHVRLTVRLADEGSLTQLITCVLQKGYVDIVEKLLQAGVDTDKPGYCSTTPLTLAAEVRAW